MNIIFLIGSYRKNGNTDQFCGLVREHLQQLAAQHAEELTVETVYLGELDLRACRGCRICFDRGEEKCPVKDDVGALREKIRASDGIIVASPLYVDDVSGLTKTWIDRNAYACHRPDFAGKCAYSIVTTGTSPTGHAMRTLQTALSTWGFRIVGQAGIITGALMKREAMKAQHQQRAEQIAARFFRALQRNEGTDPSFLSLMIFRVQQIAWLNEGRANPDTVDYRYWQQKGWLDKRTDFYIPHRAGRVKIAVARLMGSVIAKFVLK